MLLRDNAFQIMLIQTANKFQPFGLQSNVYRAELRPLFLLLYSGVIGQDFKESLNQTLNKKNKG